MILNTGKCIFALKMQADHPEVKKLPKTETAA
jgi:hypothetical protein